MSQTLDQPRQNIDGSGNLTWNHDTDRHMKKGVIADVLMAAGRGRQHVWTWLSCTGNADGTIRSSGTEHTVAYETLIVSPRVGKARRRVRIGWFRTRGWQVKLVGCGIPFTSYARHLSTVSMNISRLDIFPSRLSQARLLTSLGNRLFYPLPLRIRFLSDLQKLLS